MTGSIAVHLFLEDTLYAFKTNLFTPTQGDISLHVAYECVPQTNFNCYKSRSGDVFSVRHLRICLFPSRTDLNDYYLLSVYDLKTWFRFTNHGAFYWLDSTRRLWWHWRVPNNVSHIFTRYFSPIASCRYKINSSMKVFQLFLWKKKKNLYKTIKNKFFYNFLASDMWKIFWVGVKEESKKNS